MTRSTSIVTPGYNVPLLSITSGNLRVTPSCSGNVSTIPLPTAEYSISGILLMVPGTLGIRLI